MLRSSELASRTGRGNKLVEALDLANAPIINHGIGVDVVSS